MNTRRNTTHRLLLASLAAASLAPVSGALGANLLVNGSFEQPLVSTASQLLTIPGWTRTCGTTIEIQGQVIGWTANDGTQWWEADGVDNTCISQTIPTTINNVYQLTFAHSARPGVANNAVEVYWNGQLVVTLNANGIGNTNTAWQLGIHNLVATGPTSTLEFKAAGPSDALGGLIDNVSLELLPCNVCQGDANGDGVVNFADITAVLVNFNTICPP